MVGKSNHPDYRGTYHNGLKWCSAHKRYEDPAGFAHCRSRKDRLSTDCRAALREYSNKHVRAAPPHDAHGRRWCYGRAGCEGHFAAPEDFNKSRTYADNLHHTCRDCESVRHKARRVYSREKVRMADAINNQRRRRARPKTLNALQRHQLERLEDAKFSVNNVLTMWPGGFDLADVIGEDAVRARGYPPRGEEPQFETEHIVAITGVRGKVGKVYRTKVNKHLWVNGMDVPWNLCLKPRLHNATKSNGVDPWDFIRYVNDSIEALNPPPLSPDWNDPT